MKDTGLHNYRAATISTFDTIRLWYIDHGFCRQMVATQCSGSNSIA